MNTNFNLKDYTGQDFNACRSGYNFQCIDTDDKKSIIILIAGNNFILRLKDISSSSVAKNILKKSNINRDLDKYFHFQHAPAWKPGPGGDDIDGPKSVFSSITISKDISKIITNEEFKEKLTSLLDHYFAENLASHEIFKYPNEKITYDLIQQVRKEYLKYDVSDVKKELFGLSYIRPGNEKNKEFESFDSEATEIISRIHAASNEAAKMIYNQEIEVTPSSKISYASSYPSAQKVTHHHV